MPHSGEKASEQLDTSVRAQQRYLERLRETPARERLERALRLSERARAATMSDVRLKNPGASERALAIAFVRRVYGDWAAARLEKRAG